jgi:hypothetical protein
MAMSLSVQAADNETATSASSRPTINSNTWDGLVQQKLKLQVCVDENNPSPSKLIYGTLPTLLQHISLFESVESKQLEVIVHTLLRQGILLPYASLVAKMNQQDDPASSSPTSTTDTAQKLRTLQVQAMVRLQLWSSFGEAFCEEYAKVNENGQAKEQRRKHKKKQHKKLNVLPADLLLQHTMQILSLTAFRLAPNRPFALFLQECLPKSLLLSSSVNKLPRDTLPRIFDNFEVPNPYLARKDDSAAATATAASLNLVPSPQRRSIMRKRKAAAKQSLQAQNDLAHQQAQEKAKAKAESEKEHAKLAGTARAGSDTTRSIIPGMSLSSMSLTQPVVASRTKNSLLARDGNLARSRFVGSHFNTNALTNASSLFRQVQVTDRRQQQQRQTVATTAPGTNNNNKNNSNNKTQSLSRKRAVPSKSTSLSSSASTMASSSGSNSNSRSKENPNAMLSPVARRVVHETPNKSKSMLPPVPRRVLVHETPNKSKSTAMLAHRRNNIVLETPAKQPARSNSLLFAATTTNTDDESQQSNASLVAQAFRAVQQRKR